MFVNSCIKTDAKLIKNSHIKHKKRTKYALMTTF